MADSLAIYDPIPTTQDGSEFIRKFADVKTIDPRLVWTLFHGADGNVYALAGFHIINALGYVLTSRPWANSDVTCVWAEAIDRERL